MNNEAEKPRPAPRGPLGSYEASVTSQSGEDGVLREIFLRLGINRGRCIEFGAWDGKHLSNTWQWWALHGWDALLIEGDPLKAAELARLATASPNVRTEHAFVRSAGPGSLEGILTRHPDFAPVDLLSIDIDGDDYYILEGLRDLRPSVIVIEHNPTIPPHLALVQEPGGRCGASALALRNLGREKGYRLAHATPTNLILVEKSKFGLLRFDEPDLASVFEPSALVYVITSLAGEKWLSGPLPYQPHLKDMGWRSPRRWLNRWRSRAEPAPDRPAGPAAGEGGALIPVDVFKLPHQHGFE